MNQPVLAARVRNSKGKGAARKLRRNNQVPAIFYGPNSEPIMLAVELLMDPIKDTCIHADFYEISMDKEITVPVPIRLLNTPNGVSEGGILQHVRRELTISCLPDKLMDSLEVDVSALEIGDVLHVRDIELPEGTKSVDEGHLTIAIVAAPTVQVEEEVEELGEGEEEKTEEEAAAPETEPVGK
ncbi:MAG: 50S ribosomal protein L25 [Deltaproteobacteria bacterium]|nr:50S ribosomal protein L25 [Deltaproteobacteria bacterium]